jgi:Rho termination factor, N-terminal domain
MKKADLESKHLSDLHALAAEAGIERYRMLSRVELIEKLSDGSGNGSGAAAERPEQRDKPARERPRRRRRPREGQGDALADEALDGEAKAPPRPSRPQRAPERKPAQAPSPRQPEPASAEPAKPRRRRRRRRFGRRGKDGVTIQDLLLPPEAGRQAILAAESREACTALLRGVAADLAAASKGPDPVVLLVDPSPEELADWKRDAPRAEIVAAGQARHATDALAQASARASDGEDVMLLVDSLTRLASAYGDADSAKGFFDAGRVQAGAGGGSLTIVAAIERA